MNRRSLSFRIVWWSILWCAVVLLIYTTLYTVSYYGRSIQSYKRVLQLEIAAIMGRSLDKTVVANASNDWERYAAVTDSAIRLTNDSGDVLFEIGSPMFTQKRIETIAAAIAKQPPSEGNPSQIHWSHPYHWRDANGTHHVMAASRMVTFVNGTHGDIELFSLTDSIKRETWRTFEILLVIDVLILILFGFGMHWLIRRGLRPLRKLIQGIQAVEWNQSERLSLTALPDEVASLQQSVNQLLDHIDEGVHEQNRFIADASHELRTPLAIIAGHANLLRRWGNKNSRVWEPAVRNIVSEVERLQKLVNQLLALAKLEEVPSFSFKGLTSVDIQELFYQLRQDAIVLRPDMHIELRVHLTSKSRAYMDHDDLRQVLVGLLDNAMRHTPEGGRIELMAHGDEGMVRFLVVDNGEGIPGNVLPHVFDRFYRAEAARGRGKGSGLGLSICKQIIESYHGKIYIRSKVGHGTTVVILIPMQEHAEPNVMLLPGGTPNASSTTEKGYEEHDRARNPRTDAETN